MLNGIINAVHVVHFSVREIEDDDVELTRDVLTDLLRDPPNKFKNKIKMNGNAYETDTILIVCIA